MRGACGSAVEVCEGQPSIDHRIRIKRNALDTFLQQPLREIGMIRRPLAANADVLAGLAAGVDSTMQQHLHRRIALVELAGDDAGVAIEPERQLREIVRAERETVEACEKI